ncbi:hypothetical protein D3C85_1162100 [compost metagenome]
MLRRAGAAFVTQAGVVTIDGRMDGVDAFTVGPGDLGQVFLVVGYVVVDEQQRRPGFHPGDRILEGKVHRHRGVRFLRHTWPEHLLAG